MRNALIFLTLLASSAGAQADQKLARFDGAIGSQPFANVGGIPAPNDVNGIAPGGRPWPIKAFKASIRLDGTIEARGEGLVLGGGGAVGTAGAVTQVGATLFCNGLTIQYNSPPAPLSSAGDFAIFAKLSPKPPAPCNNPILLIRNAPAAGGLTAWFAAGIPDID